MKNMYLLFAIIIIMVIGCQDHYRLAQDYKLELGYYENAMKFENLNMSKEAYLACNRTEKLRNECFASLVQERLSKSMEIEESYCYNIEPENKMKMTKKAFEIVYDNIDSELEEELYDKINPDEQRIKAFQKIRKECMSSK